VSRNSQGTISRRGRFSAAGGMKTTQLITQY